MAQSTSRNSCEADKVLIQAFVCLFSAGSEFLQYISPLLLTRRARFSLKLHSVLDHFQYNRHPL
ncbi:MAG TPA: hypothetical protein VJ603_07285 [Paucimonas sp.]|nr:hypothetical protein [Paucimonas sp.]